MSTTEWPMFLAQNCFFDQSIGKKKDKTFISYILRLIFFQNVSVKGPQTHENKVNHQDLF